MEQKPEGCYVTDISVKAIRLVVLAETVKKKPKKTHAGLFYKREVFCCPDHHGNHSHGGSASSSFAFLLLFFVVSLLFGMQFQSELVSCLATASEEHPISKC